MLHAQSCPTLCDPIDCSLPGSSLSMGFSRQDYWSGLPFPSPGDLTDPGTESMSSALAGGFFTTEPPGKPNIGPENIVCMFLLAYVLSCFSCVRLSATLWAIALQTPLSKGFSRQEYWCRLPCPPPGDLPDSGI